MRFLPAWKYQMNGVKWPLIIYYIVIASLLVLMGVSLSIVQGRDRITVGGLEMASMIFIFVAGLNSYKPVFFMMSANGISRRTMFVSFLAMLGVVAAGMALVDTLYGIGMKMAGDYRTMFEQLYGRAANAPAWIPGGFEWRLCSYLVAGMAGYLITILYYRMNKAVKLLVSIGVPILVLFVWPAADLTWFNGATIRAVGWLIEWASGLSSGNPYIGVMSNIVLTALLGALCYLALRRAPIKTKTS
ncbi:MAG: hypothetical protein GXW96_00105 [Christensenellaceae bacterium]|nr:hypothetical protein [Christensenellaceae bacterium]